eukprot:61601-Prorocentrum_minimum.AAC.2
MVEQESEQEGERVVDTPTVEKEEGEKGSLSSLSSLSSLGDPYVYTDSVEDPILASKRLEQEVERVVDRPTVEKEEEEEEEEEEEGEKGSLSDPPVLSDSVEDPILASQRLQDLQQTWTELELLQHAVRMASELDISAHTFHFKTFEHCFTGQEAVTWMVESDIVVDRIEGVQLGEQMVQAGLIYHVVDEHGFKDMKNMFYR